MTPQKASFGYFIKVFVAIAVFTGILVYIVVSSHKEVESKFKSINMGMSEDQVIRIMGTPSSIVTEPGKHAGNNLPALKEGEKDLLWGSGPYLGVRIDKNGKVIYELELFQIPK